MVWYHVWIAVFPGEHVVALVIAFELLAQAIKVHLSAQAIGNIAQDRQAT